MRTATIITCMVLLAGCGKRGAMSEGDTPGPECTEGVTTVGPGPPTLNLPQRAAPAAAPPTESTATGGAEAGAGRCAVKNDTQHPIALVDSAIDEPLGTVAPGEVGSVGGHFNATAEGGLAFSGFCGVGASARIYVEDGKLQGVHDDGTPLTEGVEK